MLSLIPQCSSASALLVLEVLKMDCSYCLLKKENSKKLSAVIGDNETAAYWQRRTSSVTGSIMTLLPALAHLNPSHMSQIITIFIPSCSKRQVAQMQCRPLELNSAWCFSTSCPKPWHVVATKQSNGRPSQPNSSAPFTPAPGGDVPQLSQHWPGAPCQPAKEFLFV